MYVVTERGCWATPTGRARRVMRACTVYTIMFAEMRAPLIDRTPDIIGYGPKTRFKKTIYYTTNEYANISLLFFSYPSKGGRDATRPPRSAIAHAKWLR